MNKKLKFSLVIISALLFMGTYAYNADAKRNLDKYQSNAVTDTAGVSGGVGEILQSNEVSECITRDCMDLKRELRDLWTENNKNETKIISLAEKLNEKEVKRLRKEYKKLEKIAKSHNGKDYDKLKHESLKDSLIETSAKFSADVQKLLNNINENKSQMNALLPQLYKAIEDSKASPSDSSDNMDTTDVVPEESSCLMQGDLVAWGIPSVPSIPRPRPKTQPSSNTSNSSSSAPAQPSDEGYKALRSVEQESEKITDADKTEFLNELGTRAAVDTQ